MTEKVIKEYSSYGDSFRVGRVIRVNRDSYIVQSNEETITLKVSGRFNYTAVFKSDYPVVGDYVIFKPVDDNTFGIVERVCERQSVIERKGVTTSGEKQLLASNVDICFVCMSLNEDFRLRKLQNFLALGHTKNVKTVILLTKKDLCEDIDYYINEVRKINMDDEIVITSSEDIESIMSIKRMLKDKTGVFIGSSGVGKSTIVNKLLGYEYLATLTVLRSDDQGRHTTSHRELVQLDNGGAIIDTPGIRIVYTHFKEDFEDGFKIVTELAKDCRFKDCTHQKEPGCNVREKLDEGEINIHTYNAYIKTVKLNAYNRKRESQRNRMQNKRKRG